MPIDWIPLALLALLVLLLLLTLWLALRRPDPAPMKALRDELQSAVRADVQQLERSLRDEVSRSAGATRTELAQTLATFQQTLLTQQGDVARTQNEQIDSFRTQLAATQQHQADTLGRSGEQQALSLKRFSDTLIEQLRALSQSNDQRMAEVRATVEQKLTAIQIDNEKKLEQVFTPEQYGVNVETVPGSGARVEFAIKLPGRREDGAPLWLPIDAKFPREDYERLLDAQERADAPGAEAAGKAIEQRLRTEAKTIREKYVAPPHTTEFAILFVPTEGLYAEALRRPGLMEALQREYRVTLAGPTTLLATLSSLQMGFRTLALEKRSAEVWEVLGAVKTEFGKFGAVLARTKKKLDEASSTIDEAQTRTNVMTRRLKSVEALSEPRTQVLLPGAEADLADDDSA